MIEHITDHDAQAKARLISQYKKATVFKAWLSTLITRIQILEDAIWSVITQRTIDGVGIVLDNIGKILNRPRGGLSDDDYRIALRAEIAILRSTGNGDDLFTVGELSLPPGYDFTLTDLGNAALRVSIVEPVAFDVHVLFQNMTRAKQGGVKLLFEFIVSPETDAFIWDSLGFGSVTTSAAGGLLGASL